ncbi:MAG: sigma-70 family RNA polymerase sigma factor [Planctomycetales bacterium]|nr:sigma-70 family RNA polymerase sigma factor [Planctomycetales bacterium]
MTPDDTDELLQQVRRHDTAAFTQFVRRHEQSMLRTAYRIVGQIADAEEVRQVLLMRIWQSPDQLPPAGQLGGWLQRCVINESIALLRRRQRDQRQLAGVSETVPTATQPPDWDGETERLRHALNELEPEQRALLALRFDEQLTLRQIAEVLGQPHTTVQSKLQRAIGQLRARLQTTFNQP